MATPFPQARFQRAGTAPSTIASLNAAWQLLSGPVQDAEAAFIATLSDVEVLAIVSFPVSGGAVNAQQPTGQIIEVNSGGVAASQQALGNLGSTQTLTLTAALTLATGTLTANCVLTVAGLAAGYEATLLLAQNAIGGWALSVSDGTNTSAVPIPSAASAAFVVDLWSPDGTTIYVQAAPTAGATGPTGPTGPTGATGPTGPSSKATQTVTQSATPTITVTTGVDLIATTTGLAQAITGVTISGTPQDGQALIVRITDNGTGRAITWGSSFESSGNVALPTTTVASTMLTVGFTFNGVTSKFHCVGIS